MFSMEMLDSGEENDYDEELVREHRPFREDGQDSPMTDQEIEGKVEATEKESKATEDKAIKSMEKHDRVRCIILQSPEKLRIPKVPISQAESSPGSDETNTSEDFKLIKDWVTNSGLLFAGLNDHRSGTDGENLHHGVYQSSIRFAFSSAFVPMRNTKNPELEELVIWYYVGHGFSKKAALEHPYSSTPNLTELVVRDYHSHANEFLTKVRRVQGGELCLDDKFGFCDLYGLITPFVDAVKAPSINPEGRKKKKNKHLVIILDSCYSGIFALKLKDFEQKMNEEDPSFLNENTVTIQAACDPDEVALGGYFTPCFVYLNDPKKAELLNELKADWMGMKDEERNQYKALQFPSPMVATTIPDHDGTITMELTVQGFKLTLFQDPGFFKFCSVKVYQHQDKSMFDGKDRVLDHVSAEMFMKVRRFNVLDYKLKTYQGDGPTDPNANTPMGLFLLKDHKNAGYTVCAHIHFDGGLMPQLIKLVHHKKPTVGSLLYLHEEDHDGLTRHQNLHKVPVLARDRKAQDLVQACRTYVESKEPGRWNDVSQWNMTSRELGVNGLFRLKERHNQRSAWEDSYLEHIKMFDIPVVADN